MKDSLAYCISSLRKDFEEFCEDELRKLELSKGLLYFILYVGKHPGSTPGACAAALRLDTGHTTRCLEKLEKAGFLTRSRNAEDKRAVELQLTEKGNAAFERSYRLFDEWDAIVLKDLSDDERKVLLSVIQKIVSKNKRRVSLHEKARIRSGVCFVAAGNGGGGKH